MTDYFGFTMAALNENGSVFSNPCKGEKNMSTLMYRPFSSWANNSEVISIWLLQTFEVAINMFFVFSLRFHWIFAISCDSSG